MQVDILYSYKCRYFFLKHGSNLDPWTWGFFFFVLVNHYSDLLNCWWATVCLTKDFGHHMSAWAYIKYIDSLPNCREEIPPHACVKSPLSKHLRSGVHGEWSDTTISISPALSAEHKSSWQRNWLKLECTVIKKKK